jgi:hypothetical protein
VALAHFDMLEKLQSPKIPSLRILHTLLTGLDCIHGEAASRHRRAKSISDNKTPIGPAGITETFGVDELPGPSLLRSSS